MFDLERFTTEVNDWKSELEDCVADNIIYDTLNTIISMIEDNTYEEEE